MTSSSFYLVLENDSSREYYPANSLTRFTTRLPRQHDLHGEWEVGLVEIRYPHNWYNVPAGTEVKCGTRTFSVPEGYYQRPGLLLSMIERIARDQTFDLDYNPVERKIQIDNGRIWFDRHLQRLFGLPSPRLSSKKQPVQRGVVDMDPLHCLFVYCDLVEPRVIGDKMAPLLRDVAVSGEDGDVTGRTFKNPHYVPLSRKSFDTVTIDIRNDIGESIPFEGGHLKVTLHFKKSTIW